MYSHLSGIVSLNVYSVCALIPSIFFLVMAVLFFSMREKSAATRSFGLQLFVMFLFFFGYFLGTSIDRPAAAYYRFIVIPAIFGVSFLGLLFVHFYPDRRGTFLTKTAAVVSAVAAVILTSWYVIHNLRHGVPSFRFESHSWEFESSVPDMAVSIGVAVIILLFLGSGLYKTRKAAPGEKVSLALIVIIISVMTLSSSVTSALSKTGGISRGTFFLTQDFLDIAAYFIAAVVYINATKDRSSFMTKVIGISMVSFLMIAQILSYIALSNEEAAYSRIRASAAESASHLKSMSNGMLYLADIDMSVPGKLYFMPERFRAAERESYARKCWAYEKIRKYPDVLTGSGAAALFDRAGPYAAGYRAAALSFLMSRQDGIAAAELLRILDRTGAEAERMRRRISLADADELPRRAFELFRAHGTGETAALYETVERTVRGLDVRGEESRSVILSMLYPMTPSGTPHFCSGGDGSRFIEFAAVLPDDSLSVAGYDYREYRDAMNPLAAKYCALLLAMAVFILFGFRFFFFRAITHPLRLIEEGIQEARRGNRAVEVPVVVEDEIGLMARVFNGMMKRIAESELNLEGKVMERTFQLESANRELSSALALLRKTQEDLIRRERMAALGDMVAGIAHEINTPIGVALTAGSFLSKKASDVKTMLDVDSLTRSEFDSFLESSAESSAIITSNLERAAELVNSFKKVAVAQTSGELETFRLAQYFRDLLLNLSPSLKRTRIGTVIACDESLSVTTFPGAVSQIVTNLVMNSITHAFNPGEEGVISLSAKEEAGDLVIEYADNGKGISEEAQRRIFEPFFTTARQKGGTGLGLHIVYNLVTQKLGGHIRVRSEKGKGSAFIMRIPLRAEGILSPGSGDRV